jgi:hypothetical protein
MTRTIRLVTVFALVACAAPALNAQEGAGAAAPSQPAGARPRPKVQLKLTLVFSRYQGEKKLSSVPYVVPVTTNDVTTSIRMGTRVPVVSTVFAAGAPAGSVPQASYNYQNVGTEIDCSAGTLDDSGTFLFNVTVSDSSVYYPDKSEAAPTPGPVSGIPAFRNFSAKFSAVLRDGQTTQYVAATDPVSGQVVKIDATLNLVK